MYMCVSSNALLDELAEVSFAALLPLLGRTHVLQNIAFYCPARKSCHVTIHLVGMHPLLLTQLAHKAPVPPHHEWHKLSQA
jgi:uncharacterized membrane protein (Fun14 family)